MFRKTYAEINLDNLIHNLNLIRSNFYNDIFLCPMVKANAYGHGDIAVARHLVKHGVKNLGVCLIEEGLRLREAKVNVDILVFRGFDEDGAKEIIKNNLIPVVSSWDQIEYLNKHAQQPIKIHIKFDTGMNRLGFSVTDAEKLKTYLDDKKYMNVVGILTHLFSGENAINDKASSAQQLRKLAKLKSVFNSAGIYFHALNSAGIISAIAVKKNKRAHILKDLNWGLRPGLMLYGYNPIPEVKLDLKPVMTFKSQVSVIREVHKSEGISYGHTWKAKKKSTIAVVPVGYADGYHRLLSNRARALFRDELVPVVGNVCMDYMMLDISKVIKKSNKTPLHEEVILFGENKKLLASHLAEWAKTIPWEILTSVSERVPRTYTGLGK